MDYSKIIIGVLLIILVIILAIIISCIRRLKRSREPLVSGGHDNCAHDNCDHNDCPICVSGGCDSCGGKSIDLLPQALSPLGREIVGASVRVDAQTQANTAFIGGSEDAVKPTRKNGGKLTKAVQAGDQDKVARYLGKAAHSNDDRTAVELRTLKPDIINIIGAYPGLVEYARSIDVQSDNKHITDAVEDIKNAVRSKSGGADAGARDQIVEDVYALVKPYVREVGNARRVESYLRRKGKVRVTAKDVSDDIREDRGIKHKTLYEIIRRIVNANWNIENREDFIEHTGLRYEHFLPVARRKWLSLADDLDIDIIPDLRNELRVYVRDHRHNQTFSQSELNKILDKLEGSLSIFKFAPGYAKKPKTAINKAKDKAFEVDTLAVLPLLKSIANSMFDASRWTDTVNLIRDIGAQRLRTAEEDIVRNILLSLSDDNSIHVKARVIEDMERERRLRELEFKEREYKQRIERERDEERNRIAATIPAFNPELTIPVDMPSAPPVDASVPPAFNPELSVDEDAADADNIVQPAPEPSAPPEE